MTVSFLDPLLAAVVPRCNNDATLVQLLGGPYVLDYIPEQLPVPYVRVSAEERAWPWLGGRSGSELTLTALVVSRYQGGHEIAAITSRLRELLDGWRVTLAGAHEETQIGYEQAVSAYDADVDGVTLWHRPVLFSCLVV